MSRDQLPSLARMITDQTRADVNPVEREQIVETAERTIAEAYRCLY